MNRFFNLSVIWLLFVSLTTNCAMVRPAGLATLPASPQPPTATIELIANQTPTSPAPLPTTTPAPTSKPTILLSNEGPWLVYLYNSEFSEFGPGAEDFVIINQDGSGRTSIKLPDCADKVNAFLMTGENSPNFMTSINGGLHIFRPSQATGMLVYRSWWSPICNTFLTGNSEGGLLASIYQAKHNASPDLIIYELPSGKIRNRFPLIKCPAQVKGCEGNLSLLDDISMQQPKWSPNGRYLAFAAVQNTISSDLYVYDSQNGSLRQLTSGPDWVGPIWWSPDGSRIIMGEMVISWNDEYKMEDNFYLGPIRPTSVWSVSVSSDEIKLLYALETYDETHILMWLDNNRFLTHGGDSFSVVGGSASVGQNLRLVNMGSGKTRILFNSSFGSTEFDKIHETMAIYAFDTPEFPQGIYLVSTKNSTIRYLKGPPYPSFPDWDEKTGLFVSSDDCQNDPHSFQAFDYLGNFKCVPKPTPTPKPLGTTRFPAPNGEWVISLKDGIWLETEDKPAVQVSPETADNIIWCPDSSCFFFSVPRQNHQWNLYHVSLSDLTINMVDEGIKSNNYQWLGGTK